MSKKNKGMIILLALVVVLVAANAIAGLASKRAEKKAEEKEKEETIYLTQAENVASYSYSDGSETMSFTKNNDNWTYKEDSEIPVNQDTVQNTADNLRQITAVRKLKDPDDLSDYGLDQPLYTIDYTDGEGEDYQILIGDGSGDNYYATVDDSGEVYTVSSEVLDYLSFDITNYVEYDTVPSIGSGNLKKVTVTQKGEETVFKDEDDLGELAGGFGSLTLTDCVDYHVSQDAKADYGLDEDSRITVKAVYKESGEKKTFTIYLGSTDSDSNRYVMVEGSGMVYRISDSIAQNMITVSESEDSDS